MKNRFFVAVQLTQAGEAAFLAFLKEQNMGWWHRVPNVWLLTSRKEEVSATLIRDKLRAIGTTSPSALVMQVPEDVTWAGLMPKVWAGSSMRTK